MPQPEHIAIALSLLNLAAFALFGIDKVFSRSQRRRVPERILVIASSLLASPGALLAMVLFNHKTARPKFRFGVPALLLLHSALALWLVAP